LFLDEIGEMSLEMQVLLLRVLQNREIIRIGGAKVVPVNVRIIAATNKNLKEEVQKGSFREDLYFRLNVMPIHIPSLRVRRDDIPVLTEHFLHELAVNLRKRKPFVPEAIMELLKNYEWPGNVRELQNFLERAMVKSTTSELTLDLFTEEIRGMNNSRNDGPVVLPKKDELKKKALLESIQIYNGNFSKAAKSLGISRSTLYRQLERFKIRV
jgi:transcriptional regulator with PAS, ATPase and Fis domain